MHPNQKWCTDVTEFKVLGQKQKLYLSTIIDLFDRSIVSYVFDTFDKALEANPDVKLIFHSDRGFQYTSKQFKFKLAEAGMIQSMSRVSKCIDNGPIEGFWGTLKSKSFYGLKFNDEQALRNKIEEYIFFYNNYRLQRNLKDMTSNKVRYHANCHFIYF